MTQATIENTREAFRLERRPEGIALLSFDLPGEKVNKLTSPALRELDGILDEIEADRSIRAVIFLSGKEEEVNFIAGADIREIESLTIPAEASDKARQAQMILHRLSTIPQPVVAVVHGACLGGGCELALACDYRVATDHPRTIIGLPEVKLGIIPGFGGTQRLPPLVGLQKALDLILTGKTLPARKAAKIGLVDHVVPSSLLLEQVLEFTEKKLEKSPGKRRASGRKISWRDRLLERTPPGRKLLRSLVESGLRKKVSRQHYPAPYRAVEAILRSVDLPIEAGLRLESDLVGPLIVSETSKNLIAIFFGSERLRRGEGSEAAQAEEGETGAPAIPTERAARRAGVLGAGVMGGGIAALMARKGQFHVRLKDISLDAIGAGLRHAKKSFDGLLKRRRLTPQQRDNLFAAISGTTGSKGFAESEVIIEAVVEDMDIKRSVLREIEPRLAEDAIFASNTSSLSIDDLAEAAERPERVAGLHFFNPVHRMPLVEVIRGAKTSEDTVARLEALSRDLGKYPLRVQDAPGFLVNRLLMPYLNEAAYLFEEGYRMESIDDRAREFGLPMGPFELIDEVGLDVAYKVASYLHSRFGERARPAELLGKLYRDEKLVGKKGGSGFYLYPKGRRGGPNTTVFQHGGKGSLDDAPDLWIRRMLTPLVNEAARCLDEGIIEAAWQVDIGMVFGTGFPPFRGGPLRWADTLGLDNVVEFLRSQTESLGEKGGARFEVAPLLERLASEGKGFHEEAAKD